jgi:RNA recognition motif-containing protein
VRVIRDKDTFIGKGIAYIQFASPAEMKKALEAKNNSLFKGRNLRVRRATPSERREKKQEKKKLKRKQVKMETNIYSSKSLTNTGKCLAASWTAGKTSSLATTKAAVKRRKKTTLSFSTEINPTTLSFWTR